MSKENGRIFWRTAAFLIGGSILQYALFHVANLFMYDAAGVALSYTTYYYDRVWEFLFPAFSALMMLVSFSYYGYKRALTSGAVYALTRACYYIPLGYMMSISYGYDSLESILGGLVISAIVSVLVYLESLACVALALLPAYISARKRSRAMSDLLKAELVLHDPLDVTLIGTAAVGIVSLIQFTKLLSAEIVDTVEFFTGGSSYTTDEVLYVVFKYFFAIILLTGVYFLLNAVKKQAVSAAVAEIEPNENTTKEI